MRKSSVSITTFLLMTFVLIASAETCAMSDLQIQVADTERAFAATARGAEYLAHRVR